MRIRLRSMLVVLVGAASLAGCSVDENEQGMKLSLLRVADQTLSRGETNKVAITVTRGSFTGEVDVKFQNLPSGVTVVDAGAIPADDNIRSYTLHAAPDADLVERHRAEVVVSGPENLETSQAFEITVKE